VFPAGPHQLFSFGRNSIFFIPSCFQYSADSSSFGEFLSPSKQVTEIFSFGILRIFVRNSKQTKPPIPMARIASSF